MRRCEIEMFKWAEGEKTNLKNRRDREGKRDTVDKRRSQ